MWLALLVVFAGVRGEHDGSVGDVLATLLHDEAGVETRAIPEGDLDTLVDFTPAASRVVERMDVDGVIAASIEEGDVLRVVVFDHDGGLVTLFEQPLSGGAIDPNALASVIADVKMLAPVVAEEVAQVEEVDDVEVEVEEDPRVAIDLNVGLGVAGRRFAPGPMTLTGYSSTPVPAVWLAGAIRPTERLALEVAAERAFGMTSHVINDDATTTMWRWRATAVYGVHDGALHIDAVLGVGRREFAIEASEIARTPDSSYEYVELGARLARDLGRRASLLASTSFEPVVAGDDPTERMLGPSRRWGVEVAAGLELRVTRRLRLGVGANVQRFAWSWPEAGSRGAGGAADAYPSGYAVVGAAY